MKIIITTQFCENYGSTHNPYWKMKGGNDYFIKNVADDAEALAKMLLAKDMVEHDNDYTKEYIIGWELVNDDYVTQFEQQQLEFDGKITYPAEELML
ncbi:MAG: hypothetical protein EBR82_47255 [Caulobacteraceae bacterium]|nr:hypothetical protein [Caulobacteraceae bacterium]